MNGKLLITALLLPLLAGAQNLVLNGNFRMGTTGFGQQRHLRFDTNPKQHYLPLETVKLPDGTTALKITSPYTESSCISSLQFALKNNTKYTMRMTVRATAPVKADFIVYSMSNNWRGFNHGNYDVGSDWKTCEYRFQTGPKDGDGFFYHADIGIRKFKGEFFIRNVEIFESASNAENGLQFAADVKEPVLETTDKTLTWSVPVHAWNGSETPFKGTVKVTAQEQFFRDRVQTVEVPLTLAPGESKVFPVKFTTGYGCYEISASGTKASRFVPAYLAVVGKYVAKPLDFDKDFCLGLNGGLGITKTSTIPEISTTVRNADAEKIAGFFAKAGVRILREHDGGIESTAWAQLEPKEGKWDFRHLDYTLEVYKKYHLEPLACVGRSHVMSRHCKPHTRTWLPLGFPQWVYDRSTPVKTAKYNWSAAIGHSDVPPMDNWRKYVRSLVSHAKGRIRYYEVFNEPNGFLPAEVYFPYLKAFYEEAKKADPDCKVAGICVTSDFGVVGDKFTTDLMKLGAGKYMDIASFHPYTGRELNSIKPADEYIANFRKCLGKEYEKTMPVWNSEIYFVYDNDRNVKYSEGELNPARLTARMMVDLGEGIRQAQQISYLQLIQRRLFPEGWFNVHSFREILPNGSYVAFNAMARLLEAAKPVAKFKLEGGIAVYVYRKDGKLLAGIWNYQRKPGITGDLSAFELLDVYGNAVPPSKAMPMTDTPYYLKPGKLSDAEFLQAVKNLKLKFGTPVETQPHARLADFNGEKTLYVTLINVSGKAQHVTAGFSGGGLTAKTAVKTVIPAKGKSVVAIPVRESKSAVKTPELKLYVDGSIFRTKLTVVPTRMISGGTPVTLKNGDFSCVWSVAKEGKDLVMRFKVSDRTDSGSAAGNREMWEQDCIELFFDNAPLEICGAHGDQYTPETFRLFILPRLAKGKQFVSWLDKQSRFKAEDFNCVLKPAADGYEAKITIPASKVAGIIGFDVKVSDALSGKKAHRSAAWATGKANYMYRTVFNLIKLQLREKGMTK